MRAKDPRGKARHPFVRAYAFAAAAAALAAAALAGGAFAPPARAELPWAEWRDLLERVESALEEGDERAAAALLRDLARDDSERAVKVLVKVLARFGDRTPVWKATDDAVAAFKNKDAIAALQSQVAEAPDWKARALLLQALAKRKALPHAVLEKALQDREESVALAAVAEIGRTKTLAGIEALCALMARIESKGGTRGVVWQAARNVLVRALGVEREGGQDFKNYLDENRRRFVEGRGIPGGRPPAGPAAGERDGAGAGRIGETTIFGQPIHCKNVVIVLDVSGSMDIPDPLHEGGTVLRDPTQEEVDPERRRINRAKKELKRVLDELAKRGARVNLIAYSTDVELWKKPGGLHPLNAANLRSAHAFVDSFKPEGVTATDAALEVAFEAIPEADCIYLISDGFATHDGTTKIPTDLIVQRVRELNRLRHVQINTLGFVSPVGAPSADRELMEALAEATGGTYSEIR